MIRRIVAAIAALAITGQDARSQETDRRGETVVERTSYRGESLSNPIPKQFHIRNEGGSNGAGLCVISSILANGLHAGVPGLDVPDENGQRGKGSKLWTTAKGRPGGYGPGKLASLVGEVLPDEKFASYVGTDYTVLDRWSKAGYKVGATMNTGQLYHYMPIHHMISLEKYRTDGTAWVLDNNRPGYWSVMPAAEFRRRWIDLGTGWAWIWTRRPSTPVLAVGGVGLALFLLSLAALVASEAEEAFDDSFGRAIGPREGFAT